MRRTPRAAMIGAALLAGACTIGSESGPIGEQLGFSLGTPDEFLVIARKPIEIPTSFTLPAPQPGAPSLVEPDPFADAHLSLYRRPEPIRLGQASQGEQVLLSGADAASDNSVIRQVLAEEDPDAGERRFGLTSFLGVPIPATVDGLDAAVVRPVSETELLRRQGYLTPTAPPDAEDPVDKEVEGFLLDNTNPTAEEIEAARDSE